VLSNYSRVVARVTRLHEGITFFIQSGSLGFIEHTLKYFQNQTCHNGDSKHRVPRGVQGASPGYIKLGRHMTNISPQSQ